MQRSSLSQKIIKNKCFWLWSVFKKTKFVKNFWYFQNMIWKDGSFRSLEKQIIINVWAKFHPIFGHEVKIFLSVAKSKKVFLALHPFFSWLSRVTMLVCLWQFKTPSSGGHGDFWSNCSLLIFPCNDTTFPSLFQF